MEINRRLMNLLGIARKAGKLELGSEAVKESVRRHRAKLVLLSCDLSQRTVRSIRETAEMAGVPVGVLSVGMDEAEASLGKRAGAIAVNDTGFAKALVKLGAEERGGTI